MEEPLTKSEIVGELLADGQISADEAIILLQEAPQTIIYNIPTPEKDGASYPIFGNLWTTNISN
tara:strand:+ start:3133 stop:3324 length:192 start_codon:yes stop_codon:yes gene_type:complete